MPAVPPEDDRRRKPRLTKVPRKPFDPIEVNGRYFVGWPKPKVAIAITGMEQGYIEPCGCAGMDRMTGGMSRRYAFFQELRKKGWPLVAFDVGGLAHGSGLEAEIKFHTLAESKEKMGYDAVGFGADDLRLPAAELVFGGRRRERQAERLRFGQCRAVRLRPERSRKPAASSRPAG